MKGCVRCLNSERRLKYILTAALLLLVPALFFQSGGFPEAVSVIKYTLMDKSGLNITLEIVNSRVKALSADPYDGF